ncbi:MAG: molybdopterin-dependent oxidoreductase [Blastocatellia bacterium]|nr:molybdopterin-dependent oxidoreductase [Blastocatellia bacterium]MCX7752438.1 molybdopterin-dependent oxidoreductase [Blastocatellia bacterium]MDW8167447.1 molybdopterin-dependent oxidoreductase [Acidobacteriota bacterium]MDW8257375.1 molybdopterin-dependent oxidoreductase [Acidobacteriota bacterium]
MIRIRRRDFLKTCGMIGGAAALSHPFLNSLQILSSEASTLIGETPTITWKPSVCEGCTTWCAVEIGVQEEAGIKRAVWVRGNQASHTHNGFTCPRGLLALQEVYDPDRIKVPMKRTNPNKGRGVDPGFVPITWDEAIDIIANKLMELWQAGKSHTVVILRGRYTEMNPILFSDFAAIYGTPNSISHSSICAEAEKAGYRDTMGIFGYPDYDIDNADYLLLWGVDPVSSNRLVSGSIATLGDILATKKVTVIDPRLHTTAAKAHRWLPIRPGTDGALALAIAHWILVRGLWNGEFVGKVSVGGVEQEPAPGQFVAGKEFTGTFVERGTKGLVAWWNLELKDRTPEWAEAITGIPAETIKAVAEEFANAKPKAISWLGPGPSMQPRGHYAGFAIAALNGLVGSADHIGGVLPWWPEVVPGLTAWRSRPAGAPYGNPGPGTAARRVDRYVKSGPAVPLDMPAMSKSLGGVAVTNRVADAINDESPYKVEMVIGYWQNFAFSCYEAQRWEKALSKVFFVQLGTHACESTMFADIVLPTPHHMFESLSYMVQKARKYNVMALNQKVIDPLYEVYEAETEFVWLLAERLRRAPYNWTPLWTYVQSYTKPFDDGTPGETVGMEPRTAEQFHRFAVQYRTCGTGETGKANWEALLGPYKATGPNTGVGNGIRQVTYPPGYFDEQGRGARWRNALAPTPPSPNFPTRSGKFEFVDVGARTATTGSDLNRMLRTHAANHGVNLKTVLAAANYPETASRMTERDTDPANDLAFMPHWEPPDIAGDPAVYPFILIDYKSRLNREGRSQNCPWYFQFKAADPGDEPWDDVIKINPVDAARLGLRDGQKVKVTSPCNPNEGIICTLKIWEGVGPGTAAKAFGQGHWAYGRFASERFGVSPRGGSNNHIIPNNPERLSGSGARHAITRVRIEPV